MFSRSIRQFSSTASVASNIGKLPISYPATVSYFLEDVPYELCKKFTKGKDTYPLDRQVVLKGPKGVLKTVIPPFVKITQDQANSALEVSIEDKTSKVQKSMWGTLRSLINNNVIGLTEGHLAIVKFVGTGYRATLENINNVPHVSLKLGFQYTPKVRIPEGITVTSPNPTRLVIEGADKQKVSLFAAVVREYKKPEPYKGKGIFVNDETIKLKEKKIK